MQHFNRIRNQIKQTVTGHQPDREATLKELNRKFLEHVYPLPRNDKPTAGKFNLERTASKRLVVMNRYSGDVLWDYQARYALRHNAIAVGGGHVFCIDRLPDPYLDYLQRRGKKPPHDARIIAFDARTGEEQWSTDRDVFGTWLGYSVEHDILVQAGAKGRDRLHDEVGHGMAACHGNTGDPLWSGDLKYGGPVMLYHDTIITQEKALALKTGEPIRRTHPLTGKPVDWTYNRHYGCATAIGSEHLLTFRSAAAGFFDLARNGGTGNLGGFKAGCTSNLIVAGGVLNAPDYTRTCTCSYQNQASLALIHDPDAEMWTFSDLPKPKDRVVRLGLNLGAPGDSLASDGTLWLDYPSTGGQSPDVPVEAKPDSIKWFRHHASRFHGKVPTWIVASGAEGLDSLTITLSEADAPAQPHTVRLYFAEPDESTEIGDRVFNVSLNDTPVLTSFDIMREAEVARRGIAISIPDVTIAQTLTLHLTPASDSKHPPLLCGIELLAER